MVAKRRKGKRLLLGVGLDDDGHVRITKGPNYQVHGGSESTHETMQEITAKVSESLQRQGTSLGQASKTRLSATIDEVARRVMGE